jgi:hypothetical protein
MAARDLNPLGGKSRHIFAISKNTNVDVLQGNAIKISYTGDTLGLGARRAAWKIRSGRT